MSSEAWWGGLYLIPSEEDENVILYSPSKYAVGLVTPENASKIAAAIKGAIIDNESDKNSASRIISQLKDLGFLGATFQNKGATFPASSSCRSPVVGRSSIKYFSPHEVTLDLTRKCNMRCVYCYSHGGDSVISMQPDCGRAAIDFCIANAKRKGVFFGLHFHGGGEPSQAFNLLRELWLYSKRVCEEKDVELKSSVITNGLISSRVLDFYVNHIDEITLSMDGDQSAQDLQRPSSGGGPTFAHVFKTGKRLLELRKKFNIRMTVTAMNVKRLESIVEFLILEFPGCTINAEPVTLVGRAIGNDDIACDPLLFAEHLYASFRIGMKAGATVFYSGVSGHSQRQEFCAASTPSFCVCADGGVTSCFSYSNRDIVKDLFVYGRYSEATNKFEFDRERIRRLQSLTMTHDNYCDQCFCRSHCIGDCPALRKFELTDNLEFIESLDMDFMLNRRCATNRRIVTLLLNDIARGRMETHGHPEQYKA